MENRYNLDNLEASFKLFLTAGNRRPRTDSQSESGAGVKNNLMPVSIKNYLSDIRHFLGWLIFYLRANSLPKEQLQAVDDESFIWVSLINKQTIFEYRSYMQENKLPNKSVNRRLSTVRKFCSFCISQGWLKENPAKQITNVGLMERPKILTQEDVLLQFEQSLLDENLDSQTIKNYLNDVQELLSVAAVTR